MLEQIAQNIITPTVILGLLSFIFYKTFNLGELYNKIAGALEDIKHLKEDAHKLSKDITIVKTHLISNLGMDAGLFGINSPISLRPEGERILTESNFKQIYKENKDMFIEIIKEYNIETEADIDEASIDVMERLQESELFGHFKDVAFKNGITLEMLLRTCAIYLRDMVTSEVLN